MPVHDRVKQHAAVHPAATAINLDGATLSWQQLWRYSQELYQHLCRLELAGNRIGIATGNALAFPVAWLAATAQPFTAAIIDPETAAEQLRIMLSELSLDLLLLRAQDHSLIALAGELGIRWMAADLWQNDRPLPDDPAFCGGMHADTPFLINFTSGTTSLPKAFIRSRRSWRCSFEQGEAVFQLEHAPSTLFPGPLCHGIGLYCLNETLYAGGTFYCLNRWQPAAVLQLIEQHAIERLVAVPTMVTGLAQTADGAMFASLKALLCAGAKLELNHYRQARALFPEAVVQEYYGASELGFIAVSRLDETDIRQSIASVGRAFPGVTLTIRNECGELLATGQPGTIYVTSEQTIDRYLWGDDGSGFCQHPWGATVGDIGYLDAQQRLHVIGRRGNMIVSGGNNIYLSEIESVLKSLPGVCEAMAIAQDDAYLGKRIVAVIEADDDACARVVDACRQRLAKYKLPRQFYRIRRWPLTPGGKIQRAALEKSLVRGDAANLTEISIADAGRCSGVVRG